MNNFKFTKDDFANIGGRHNCATVANAKLEELAQYQKNTINKLINSIKVCEEALIWADQMLTARDEMNSKVHCAPIRLSPITERVKGALSYIKDDNYE